MCKTENKMYKVDQMGEKLGGIQPRNYTADFLTYYMRGRSYISIVQQPRMSRTDSELERSVEL